MDNLGPGEKAQEFRVPPALTGDLTSVSSTCLAAHNCLQLQFWEIHGTSHGGDTHIYAWKQSTHTHKNFFNNLKKTLRLHFSLQSPHVISVSLVT